MPTLSDALAIERDRCSLLMQEYARIGSAGAFGAALVRDAVGEATAAARAGEPDSMQRALERLQACCDLRPATVAGQKAAEGTPRALPPRQALCAPAQRYLQAA